MRFAPFLQTCANSHNTCFPLFKIILLRNLICRRAISSTRVSWTPYSCTTRTPSARSSRYAAILVCALVNNVMAMLVVAAVTAVNMCTLHIIIIHPWLSHVCMSELIQISYDTGVPALLRTDCVHLQSLCCLTDCIYLNAAVDPPISFVVWETIAPRRSRKPPKRAHRAFSKPLTSILKFLWFDQ